VNKRLRDAVIFSRQNLLNDPPFSKLDLISCRNVLIYLESEAQKKVRSMFSFALNTGGYLLLGKSEGIAGAEELFERVSKQDRIYRSTNSKRTPVTSPVYGGGLRPDTGRRERGQAIAVSLAQANQAVLLKHFNASIVLVDDDGQIRHFYGQTEKYLGHPTGLASLNILDMTTGTLSARLRHAMEKVLKQGEPVSISHVPLARDGARMAHMTVMRVPRAADAAGVLAIIFEDVQETDHSASVARVSAAEEPIVAQLESEMKALRSELRSNAEEFDTASEELKAANEEIMSMNEELQSANEELEASKEELQSLNEELITINGQLTEKVTDLAKVNTDLANLLNATDLATIFLDSHLRIKWFTPRATEVLNLIPEDVGRSVSHITQNFAGEELLTDAKEILKGLFVADREVHARDGDWYTLRVLPYRTLDNQIVGVVLTFSNVTRLKLVEARLDYERTYAESIVETVQDPLIVLDGQLRVMSANPAFYQMFKISQVETIGRCLYDLAERQWDIQPLRHLLEEIIPEKTSFQDFRVEHEFAQIGRVTMLFSGRRIIPIGDIPELILVTIVDVTEQERTREALRERTALAERRADQLRQLAFQLAQTEERERKNVAYALHENLQQLLVAAKFRLEKARLRFKNAELRKSVDETKDILDQSIQASRALTLDLSPPILSESGLSAAIPWLARRMESQHGLKVLTDINATIGPKDGGVSSLLFSALRELLLNVIKHAQVKLARVQLGRIDDDHIQIVVSDEGVGFDLTSLVPAENWETGLGLFSIRERLEHVGGQFTVDTAPGRGTRVTLVAPMPRERSAHETAAARPTEARVSPSPATSGVGRKIRVLLVDDHTIVRKGLMGLLKQEDDIEVIAEAGNGQEAIELAHRIHPDVVVMDLSMPGVNGVEATMRITAELPGIQVIGLSMYEEAFQADAMLEAGAKAYLSKVGPLPALIAAIRDAAAHDHPVPPGAGA
jgi:PAS domain S-box-containing protein